MRSNFISNATALELIDELISCWALWDTNEDFYLNVLAPSIVESGGSERLMEDEKHIVSKLRQLLRQEEWERMPDLIRDRRAGKLSQLASDRDRQEAERRKAEEQRKIEAEHLEKELRIAEEQRKLERARREAERKKIEEQQKLEELLKGRKNDALARIRSVFETNYLTADEIFKDDPDAKLISEKEYHELKIKFVQDWIQYNLTQSLDSEQAAAIAADSGDVQVIARAGSGKTRTLIARAIFLQKHCAVRPNELLLLAFNKKAADEMKDRLEKALKPPLPHVMTFHALAYAITHPREQIIFENMDADQTGLSRAVQEVIDEHIRSEEYSGNIRELMLAHFRDDWERIVDGRFQLSMDEFLSYRRSLPRESLKGDYIKSFGEKIIANTLFEHGIDYRYERNFRWDDFNYRPDFTIFNTDRNGVIIEYFGLQGDADYDKMSAKKREFWMGRNEWTFIEFTPKDIVKNGVNGFTEELINNLRKVGIPCRRLSDEEIWERVKRRAIDSFTKAMQTFISRCRKQNLSPDDLNTLIQNHKKCSNAEALFLDVGLSVYTGYLSRLAKKRNEDFDGIMWRAISRILNGQTRFVRDKGRERGDVSALRFVMIDEFQDFSQMFFELVAAIRSKNSIVRFFCVGDDWQAINSFAGSNLSFFQNFDRYFNNISKYYIRTNYRSPKELVDVGNALMRGQGMAANAKTEVHGWVRLCKLDDFIPTAIERDRHNGDEITPALLRLVRKFLDLGLDVIMLSRRNGVPWYVSYDDSTNRIQDALARFLELVRSYLPEEDRGRVTVLTVHRFKGLERDAVIVLDAIDRSYPLIHPNWVFLRVFGDSIDSIENEERRLFYVAISRAQKLLALLTEMPTKSPYLDDIQGHVRLTPLEWGNLPPVASLDGPRFEIRVSGQKTYQVKDQLKDLNFRWDASSRCWHKSTMEDGFSFDALLAQPWANHDIRVEVYSETGKLIFNR